MKDSHKTLAQRIRMRMKNDIFAGSFFLIASSVVTSLLGAIFWIVCARLFPPVEVGLSVTLISAMTLITTLTTLGFDIDIIRFWKEHDKESLVSTTHAISFLLALFVSSVVFSVLLVTKYSILQHKVFFSLAFVVLASLWTVFNLNDSVYIAMKKTSSVLFKQSVFAVLKLLLPFLLLGLGFFSVFMSWGLSALLALVAVLIFNPVPFAFSVDFRLAKSILKYSIWNYLSGIVTKGRELMLPIMVTYLIGPENSAYLFIAFSVIMVFMLVPKAVSKILLREISASESSVLSSLKDSLSVVLFFSISELVVVLLFGKYVLLLYGARYVKNSAFMLYLFSFAGVFASISEVYYSMLRKQLRLKLLLSCQSFALISTMALSFILFGFGVQYIALSWLIAEFLAFTLVMISCYDINPVKVFSS